MEISNVRYQKSVPGRLYQGNQAYINSLIAQGYQIYSGDNGSYIMGKDADIKLDVDGETHSVRDLVLDYYGRERLSKGLYNRFCKDFFEKKTLIVTSDDNNELIIETVN